MEEYIRQKNVEENFQLALEHNPELVVGSVCMLYCNMKVNGTPVKASDLSWAWLPSSGLAHSSGLTL